MRDVSELKFNPSRFKYFFSLLFLTGYALFMGCATDPVAWDVTEYVNQGILGIAELERRPLARYASARGEEYTTEAQLYHILKYDVLPEYERFFSLLKQIDPQTPEVRRLHYTYVNGVRHIYRGFKIKIIGLERNDDVLIRAANEMIEKGRMENEKWQKDLATLYEAHRIGFTKSLWVSQ